MINYKKEIKRRLIGYEEACSEISITPQTLLNQLGTLEQPKQPKVVVSLALKAYLLQKDGWDLNKMILEGIAEKK